MKMILATLSAILALGAVTGTAAARSGDRQHAERGAVVLVDDGWRGRDHRGGHRGEGGFRHGRGGDAYEDVLPERRIIRRLIRQGFVSVEDIRLRRDRYIVEAVRPNGALVRLAIDAYDGEVLARKRIGWVRDGGHRGPGRGWGRPEGEPGLEFDFGGGSLGLYRR